MLAVELITVHLINREVRIDSNPCNNLVDVLCTGNVLPLLGTFYNQIFRHLSKDVIHPVCSRRKLNKFNLYSFALADPRGAPGTRPPPGGPNSFIFMQFSAKMWKIIAILGVGAPPGENPGSATDLLTLLLRQFTFENDGTTVKLQEIPLRYGYLPFVFFYFLALYEERQSLSLIAITEVTIIYCNAVYFYLTTKFSYSTFYFHNLKWMISYNIKRVKN